MKTKMRMPRLLPYLAVMAATVTTLLLLPSVNNQVAAAEEPLAAIKTIGNAKELGLLSLNCDRDGEGCQDAYCSDIRMGAESGPKKKTLVFSVIYANLKAATYGQRTKHCNIRVKLLYPNEYADPKVNVRARGQLYLVDGMTGGVRTHYYYGGSEGAKAVHDFNGPNEDDIELYEDVEGDASRILHLNTVVVVDPGTAVNETGMIIIGSHEVQLS